MNTYTVTLERHDYTIDERTHAAIMALLTQGRCCKACGQPFTDARPLVMENRCLPCAVCYHHLEHLRYAVKLGEAHLWLDEKSHVYTSSEHDDHAPRRDRRRTLEFHGFRLPEQGQGKPLSKWTEHYHFYGDVYGADVVILHYIDSHAYQGPSEAFFILRKDAAPEEFTKRSGCYQQARRVLAATKDARGDLHWNGETWHFYREVEAYQVCQVLADRLAGVLL